MTEAHVSKSPIYEWSKAYGEKNVGESTITANDRAECNDSEDPIPSISKAIAASFQSQPLGKTKNNMISRHSLDALFYFSAFVFIFSILGKTF